jgi:hypothetical protein
MADRTQELAGATMSEHDGVRYLHLDTPWVQGAMRLAKPQSLELEYIQRMMAWMLWRPEDQVAEGHAVQLGLGAGAITRFCHKVLRMRTTAVEINPTVITANRLWFRLPADDGRLAVVEGDAAHWVADPAHLGSVQVLNVDLYDHEAAAPVLDEPTSGMSRSETLHFTALIRALTLGRTLLTIEHDMDVVFGLADRIAVLAQGEILCVDTPAAVRANARVQQAYLGALDPAPAIGASGGSTC